MPISQVQAVNAVRSHPYFLLFPLIPQPNLRSHRRTLSNLLSTDDVKRNSNHYILIQAGDREIAIQAGIVATIGSVDYALPTLMNGSYSQGDDPVVIEERSQAVQVPCMMTLGFSGAKLPQTRNDCHERFLPSAMVISFLCAPGWF
jgi:hypothetical protein